jgi:hypothetical protein
MENRILQAQNATPKRQLKNKEQKQKRKGQAEEGEEERGKQTHKIKSGEEKNKISLLTNTAENRTPEERPEREEEAAARSSGRRAPRQQEQGKGWEQQES